MNYLGFQIYRNPWQATRGTLIVSAATLKELKMYLRAIHAAERSGLIRKEER